MYFMLFTFLLLKGVHMTVKHTPTDIVHEGSKGGKTGCGTDTKEHGDHWVTTSERVTCDKNGCKN
jgi:hypothetical protein